jgi:hypothetical protein
MVGTAGTSRMKLAKVAGLISKYEVSPRSSKISPASSGSCGASGTSHGDWYSGRSQLCLVSR